MSQTYEVVFAGAGHNALTAAGYYRYPVGKVHPALLYLLTSDF